MIPPPTSRWYYLITPNTSYFRAFYENFQSPDIRIWVEDDEHASSCYGWESRHLDDVSSVQDFFDRAAALKAIFHGAMYLYREDYKPFRFDGPHAHKDDDRQFLQHSANEADVRVEPFSQHFLKERGSPNQDPLRNLVSKLLFLARYDQVARDVLKYTGVNGLSYFTFYAYRDWMRNAGWADKRIACEASWSIQRLNDFTNTANNPAYLGPLGRHGGTTVQPKRPVPLEEAAAAMKKAMLVLLNEQARSTDLESRWKDLSET